MCPSKQICVTYIPKLNFNIYYNTCMYYIYEMCNAVYDSNTVYESDMWYMKVNSVYLQKPGLWQAPGHLEEVLSLLGLVVNFDRQRNVLI